MTQYRVGRILRDDASDADTDMPIPRPRGDPFGGSTAGGRPRNRGGMAALMGS